MVMLLLFPSCGGKKKITGDAITERDSMAVMQTSGVTTLISDSGVTRYRVNTEEWLVFDRKKPSYWAFEKGVYLEQFDSIFHIEASIKADTARWIVSKSISRPRVIFCCSVGIKIHKDEYFPILLIT